SYLMTFELRDAAAISVEELGSEVSMSATSTPEWDEPADISRRDSSVSSRSRIHAGFAGVVADLLPGQSLMSPHSRLPRRPINADARPDPRRRKKRRCL